MNEFCDNPLCENPGNRKVPVSVTNAGDERRTLCAACEEAYTWGVQHGTMREAAARAFIAVVTDRGMVAFARVLRSQIEAENALVRFLRRHHGYRGGRCIHSLLEWVGEQAYLTAEIVEQDAVAEPQMGAGMP